MSVRLGDGDRARVFLFLDGERERTGVRRMLEDGDRLRRMLGDGDRARRMLGGAGTRVRRMLGGTTLTRARRLGGALTGVRVGHVCL